MKIITMDDIKKMWMDAPEKESVVEFYCYKNNLESDKISEDDKNKIYSELYPIEFYIMEYYDTMFYYGECEPDDEVREIYDQMLEELF